MGAYRPKHPRHTRWGGLRAPNPIHHLAIRPDPVYPRAGPSLQSPVMSDQSARQLSPFLEANPTLIGLATFVLGIIVTIWMTRFAGYSLRETLEDPASRAALISDYRKPGAEAYFGAISHVLTFADRVYGARLISWQSFGRCLTLAYIYPLLAALFGWFMFNAGSLGSLDLFSQDLKWPIRALVAGGLVISWAIAGYGASKAGAFSDWVFDWVDRFRHHSGSRPSIRSNALRVTADLVAVVGVFLGVLTAGFAFVGAFVVAVSASVAIVGTAAVSGDSAVAIAFVIAGAFAVAFASAIAVTFVIAVILVFAFSFAGANPDLRNLALLLVFAFVLLPLLNAIADTLSVAITRKFLGHLKSTSGARPGLRRILAHLALDLLLALGCLVLLLLSLRYGLDLWRWLSPDTLPFDWRDYIQTIQSGDWGHGTALYLMVFTTLIPTLVHVIAGLGAVLTHRSRMLSRVADALTRAPDTLSKIEINRLVAQVRNAHFYYGTLATCLVIGGDWILWRIVGEISTRLPFSLF